MIERKKLTPEQVYEFYKKANVSDSRLAALQVSINRIPEKGKFGMPTVGKIPIKDNKETVYPAIEVLDEEDNLVGSVAIGSLYAGEATPIKYKASAEQTVDNVEAVETQQIKKEGANKDKFMVKSVQINNLARFGSSQELVVSNLFGKKFVTRPHRTIVARVSADGSQFKAKAVDAAKQFDIKTIYYFDIE